MPPLSAIYHLAHTLFFGAMRATEERTARFDAVADDFAAAMTALRRQRMNGAFKTIEVVRNAVHHNFDRFVIFVAARFAGRAAVSIAATQRRLIRLPIVAEIAA